MKEEAKVEESTDQSKAQEETKKESEKVPVQPKPSMKERFQARCDSMSDKIKEKNPSLHEKGAKYINLCIDVWSETFPNNQSKVQDKISKRKERAKLAREWEDKQKDMTPEEIAAMEESIPEWKRNALVIASDDEEEEKQKRGIIGRMKGRIGDKLNETEAAQNFYGSEEYKKIENMRKEVKEFKADLKD